MNLQSPDIKNLMELHINKYLENYNVFSLKEISIGPFITNKIKLYCYNPAIILKDNKMIGLIRTGSYISTCFENNKFNEKDFKNSEMINILSQYLDSGSTYDLLLYWELDNISNYKLIDNFKYINKYKGKNNGFQDCRLFNLNNKIWCYGHYTGKLNDIFVVNPVIFNLNEPNNIIYLKIENMGNREKNWMPFEYNNELYFIYSITPHIILKCDIKNGFCSKIYETDNIKNKIIYNHIKDLTNLKYIGSNVPPVLIKINDNNYYLGIGHVSQDWPNKAIRKSFFYIFTCHPPFEIVMYGKPFDILTDYYAPVEFICGLIIKDNVVTCSVGINDTYSILCDFNLNEILKTLTKI